MINWIKLTDRVPHKGQIVLTFTPRYDYVCLGKYLGEDEKYQLSADGTMLDSAYLDDWELLEGDASSTPLYDISHWAEFNFPKD